MEFEVVEQYRNMKEILDEHPQVSDFAIQAMKNLNIEPIMSNPRRHGWFKTFIYGIANSKYFCR